MSKVSEIPLGSHVGDPIGNPHITPIKDSASPDVNSDWVYCNLCNARVNLHYLDKHLLVHAIQHNPKTSSNKTQSSSTSIVRFGERQNTTTPSSSFLGSTDRWSNKSQSSQSSEKTKISFADGYKFRKLEHICASGSSSKSGRYSDFTLVFWEDDKTVYKSHSYMGGSNATMTKEWERFTIHIAHDSLEDYYVISSKFLKRSQYSTWDSEGESIPDRICNQKELLSEVKRILIYNKISPKVAYKKFRKLLNKDIINNYNDDGKVSFVQTKNYKDLVEKLKASNTPYSSNYNSGYNYPDYD